LMRELIQDPQLSRYSCIIIDEAHERTIHTDVLLSFCYDACRSRPDLRLLITSATLDCDKISAYFDNCPVFVVPGRTHPVETLYRPSWDYIAGTLEIVTEITRKMKNEGDILCFLTGQDEIEAVHSVLKQRLDNCTILPFYSALPQSQQDRVMKGRIDHKQRVILSTNIAETSLTIPNVVYVVDCGFVKQNIFNSKLRMEELRVVQISQASAKQRTGRAGRIRPGYCFRLYSQDVFTKEMPLTNVPEIQRSNMSQIALHLKCMGVQDLLNFNWVDHPGKSALVDGLNHLYRIGAIDGETGRITVEGKRLMELPLDVNLSKILLESIKRGCQRDALSVVSALSASSVFQRHSSTQYKDDFIRCVEIWNQFSLVKPHEQRQWCEKRHLKFSAVRDMSKIREQLISILKCSDINTSRDKDDLNRCLIAGLFANIAKRDHVEGFRTLSDGMQVWVHPGSCLFHRDSVSRYVIFMELVLTSKEWMRMLGCVTSDILMESGQFEVIKEKGMRELHVGSGEKLKEMRGRGGQVDDGSWRPSINKNRK